MYCNHCSKPLDPITKFHVCEGSRQQQQETAAYQQVIDYANTKYKPNYHPEIELLRQRIKDCFGNTRPLIGHELVQDCNKLLRLVDAYRKAMDTLGYQVPICKKQLIEQAERHIFGEVK